MPLYKEALPLLAGLFAYYLKGSSQVLDNRSILKGENIYTFHLKDLYFSNERSEPIYSNHLYLFLTDPGYKKIRLAPYSPIFLLISASAIR
ncbi:hypothetical protein Tsumi_10810 [Porphyromonas miyakawae]|uniref:Uncharacterized protein n=1 Tax=Porphyromonas miyakawae TaxID=3137470 RepID=A0ABQ0E2N3_9PORP